MEPKTTLAKPSFPGDGIDTFASPDAWRVQEDHRLFGKHAIAATGNAAGGWGGERLARAFSG